MLDNASKQLGACKQPAIRAHLSIAALANTRATPLKILLASSRCLGESQDMLWGLLIDDVEAFRSCSSD